MASSTKFNFPFESLTPISGKPTNTTLQLLQQRQFFTNARSVPSARGGGLHGHLAILLSDADYIARVGVAFEVPIHPGPPPDAVGTAAAIAVLTAINASFLSALEDPDFGFGDVTPLALLEHLRTEYGTMTPEELERNRSALSEPWNFDDPIEDLWSKISNIQRVATLGAVPIPDLTVITLTLAMIEKTGLLASTTEKFRLRPSADWTLALFKAEFKLGNQERVRRLTASDAGFHGAHHASVITPPPPIAAAATAAPPRAPPATPAQHVSVEGGKLYYCWTHGLSQHRNHTSATCHNKATGHRDDATAFRMQGGNNTIATGRPRRLPATGTSE
ncbi:hypothetical protein MHU86_3161 [Fragilaria crotonensis]|nr:hypothetical protein MHU86_3161 [Fragilaria crotonensis]